MTPPTVVAVKFSSTHDEISLLVLLPETIAAANAALSSAKVTPGVVVTLPMALDLSAPLTFVDGKGDTVRTSDMLEKIGSVVSAIPDGGGFGVVSLSVGGHITRLNARSSVAVPAGTQVSVTQVISPTAVQVEPLFLP